MDQQNKRIISLLSAMERKNSSDLFLCEGKVPAARIHGRVKPLKAAALHRRELEELVRLAAGESGFQRFLLQGDLDVGLSLDSGRRFRLNVAKQQGLLSVVARAVPSGSIDIDDLGLPEGVRSFANLSRGLVLVTGATGSGKSTTLASMIHHINSSRPCHIVAIDDPIEFVHLDIQSRVSQREVGPDTDSFGTALRHVVRQSPDVILLGEMRDLDTMQVAIAAALTGHLVLASVHTIDATQTVQRILSYFPEHQRDQAAMDLSMSLKGVISQRLLPKNDGNGRVVATEFLTVGPAVSKLLREQRVRELEDLMRSTKSVGMRTFNHSLLSMYNSGEISYEVGLAYATNRDEFALQAQGMSSGAATFSSSVKLERGADLDIKSLLRLALERGASDLHLTSGRPPILRRLGKLEPVGERELTDGDMRMLLYSILTARQRSLYELEQEIDFALALDNGQRFRVNAYYQKGHMAAALRAIPDKIPQAEDLGLPEQLLNLGAFPHGLLLVVGPTGAGKSTTLACLLDRINKTRSCRVITIEDPVEYTHTSRMATVDQRELFADTKSFAAALKYILRQDPDVILVGEMRDLETMGAVLTAAETGHLVLATLHSNDAAQAIDRIIDVFPPHQQAQARSQLSSSLLGIVSQRLLPRIDGKGRIAAFEMLVATTAVRNLIRDNKLHQISTMMEASAKDGMVTMDRALLNLYQQGEVTYDAAVRFMRNPKMLPIED